MDRNEVFVARARGLLDEPSLQVILPGTRGQDAVEHIGGVPLERRPCSAKEAMGLRTLGNAWPAPGLVGIRWVIDWLVSISVEDCDGAATTRQGEGGGEADRAGPEDNDPRRRHQVQLRSTCP
jgi:hypothetical protein